MDFESSFAPCCHFRLLYWMGTNYPIMGALYFVFGQGWQIYDRINLQEKVADRDGNMKRDEIYKLVKTCESEPGSDVISAVFSAR